jgi:hypothetical protein
MVNFMSCVRQKSKNIQKYLKDNMDFSLEAMQGEDSGAASMKY